LSVSRPPLLPTLTAQGTARRPLCPQRPHLGEARSLRRPCRWGWTVFAQGILGRVDRFELPKDGATLRQGEPAFAALQSGKRIEFVSPVDGVVCAVNERINVDPAEARKEPYGKGWAFMLRPSKPLPGPEEAADRGRCRGVAGKEARSFTEFLSLHRAVPVEVGATLPDGGVHVEGIMETMDGEILKIAIRKFLPLTPGARGRRGA